MTAFADNSAPTLSEDYQTIYMNGNTYQRFNASMIDTNYFFQGMTVELSATQQESIDNVNILANESCSLLEVEMAFKDGSLLTAYFMKEDAIDTYNKMVSAPDALYTVDFKYPNNNQVPGIKELYTANPVVLDELEINRSDSYDVYINIQEDMRLLVGALLITDDHYYYVDFKEIGVTGLYNFNPYEFSALSAYEITDTSLLEAIKTGETAYYNDDLGFFYDDNFTEAVAQLFLIIVFAVLPAIALILFLILAIRAKGIYRKLFAIICGCSGVELILFTIIAIIL
jgi:hypothetical protein